MYIAQIARACLKHCDDNGITSLAIPPLGTGIAGVPFDKCVRGFITGFAGYLKSNPSSGVTKIGVIIFDEATFKAFSTSFSKFDFKDY
jgi:O-acetyl-ADP-ribose deacetylase (regulator of RNase III)